MTVKLQWGRRRSRRINWTSSIACGVRNACFNGAADDLGGSTYQGLSGDNSLRPASMGPPTISADQPNVPYLPYGGGMLQWGRRRSRRINEGRQSPHAHPMYRFNG
ncbi:hypothetical protein, partial [Bacillus mycoides]|uniref:hypothetical protein n=1 Tax=Bacillus mycoides TaxID=1405 RepID=UPI001E5DC7D9